MERVGKSVLMYSFVKDGQGKGERLDGSVSVVSAGQTFRVRLQDFMYEEKKGGSNVFPSELDVIPAFSVVEVMINSSNQGAFEQGYGFSLARVRPCEFSLYSLTGPLGLGLLPPTYDSSIQLTEGWRDANPGLKRILEEKNTGFFGRITQGSYLIRSVCFSLRLAVFCLTLPPSPGTTRTSGWSGPRRAPTIPSRATWTSCREGSSPSTSARRTSCASRTRVRPRRRTTS